MFVIFLIVKGKAFKKKYLLLLQNTDEIISKLKKN